MKKGKKLLVALLSILCGASAVFAVTACEEKPDDKPPVVDPTPVDPTPVDPTPVDPTPVDPTPVDPTPSEGVAIGDDVIIDGRTYQKANLEQKTLTNNDASGDWWNGNTTDFTIPEGDFALVYRWENARDVNWYQDVVYEFESEGKFFDKNAMNDNKWGDVAKLSSYKTYIDGVEGTLPAQGDSAAGVYGGKYTASLIRAGERLYIDETLESASGKVYRAVSEFTGMPTGEVKARLVGNPFWADNIEAHLGGVSYDKDKEPSAEDPTPVDPTPVDPTPVTDELVKADVVVGEKTYKKVDLAAQTIKNNDASGDWWNGGTTDFAIPEGDFALVYRWKNERDADWCQDAVYEFNTSSNVYFDMNALLGNPWANPAGQFPMGTYLTTYYVDGKEASAFTQPNTGAYAGVYTVSLIRAGDFFVVDEILEATSGKTLKAVTTFDGFTTEAMMARIAGNPYWIDDIEAYLGGVEYEKEEEPVEEYVPPVVVRKGLEAYEFGVNDITYASVGEIETNVVIVNRDLEPEFWRGGVVGLIDNSLIALPEGNFALTWTFNKSDNVRNSNVVFELSDGTDFFDVHVLYGDAGWTTINSEKESLYTKCTSMLFVDGKLVDRANFPVTDSDAVFVGEFRVNVIRLGSELIVDQTLVSSFNGKTYRELNVYEGFTTAELTTTLTGNPYYAEDIFAFVGTDVQKVGEYTPADLLVAADSALAAKNNAYAAREEALAETVKTIEENALARVGASTLDTVSNAVTRRFDFADGKEEMSVTFLQRTNGGATFNSTNVLVYAADGTQIGTLAAEDFETALDARLITVTLKKGEGKVTLIYAINPLNAGANYEGHSTLSIGGTYDDAEFILEIPETEASIERVFEVEDTNGVYFVLAPDKAYDVVTEVVNGEIANEWFDGALTNNQVLFVKNGDAANTKVPALPNIAETGLSVSFHLTSATGDWASPTINAGGMIVTLPNLDPWNNTIGYAQTNKWPEAANLFNGGVWDCFLNTDCFVTITLDANGVTYYKNGTKVVAYAATDLMGNNTNTVASFVETLLAEAKKNGFTALGGVAGSDLVVTTALDADGAQALFGKYYVVPSWTASTLNKKDVLFAQATESNGSIAVPAIATAENGISVSFYLTSVEGNNDWASHVFNAGGIIISLPNISPWNVDDFGETNRVPYAENKVNGGEWDSFLSGSCFVTITLDKDGNLYFYKEGVKVISYGGEELMWKEENPGTIGAVIKAALTKVKANGFTALGAVEGKDLVVTTALNDTEVKNLAKAYADEFYVIPEWASADVTVGSSIYSKTDLERKSIVNGDTTTDWDWFRTTEIPVSGEFAIVWNYTCKDANNSDIVVEFHDYETDAKYFDVQVLNGEAGWGAYGMDNTNVSCEQFFYIDGAAKTSVEFTTDIAGNYKGECTINVIRKGTRLIVDQVLVSENEKVYREVCVYSGATIVSDIELVDGNIYLNGNPYFASNIQCYLGGVSEAK